MNEDETEGTTEVPTSESEQEREAKAAFDEQTAGTHQSAHQENAQKNKQRQKQTREKAAARVRTPRGQPKPEKTHLIKLHNNSEIPPGGQYVGVNGRWILLVPNVEMEVPESALEVIDNAVRLEAEKDEHNRVVGTREVPRFPYTFVRRPRG